MARYQSVRNRLSARLFDATEAVAGYDWDTPTFQRLLREVSASMSDEVDHLVEQAAEALPFAGTGSRDRA